MRALVSTIATVLFLLVGCGETDADRIDAFVAAVTGELSEARLDAARATYVDLTEQPLDVGAFGDGRVYRAEHADQLEADARRRLPRVYGQNLRVLRKQVDIQDKRAHVELQLLGGDGLANVRFELSKRGERWLLAVLRINN